MKKIVISTLLANILLITSAQASVVQSSKEIANKAMFWKKEHLKEIEFSNLYPKRFYEKSYIGFVLTGTVIIGYGAFSYFTAGAGAQVAAPGVAWIASKIAGGGAGSYMAGLSIVGSSFGGNAMLGSAILNGISFGITGGGASWAAASIGTKALIMSSVFASGLDGVYIFINPETGQLEYKIRVNLPKNKGSKKTRDIVDELYEIDKKIAKANEDKYEEELEKLTAVKEIVNGQAKNVLTRYLADDSGSQEDYLVLGTIAWNIGELELFSKSLEKIEKTDLKNSSFLDYLIALSYLHSDINKSKEYLLKSIDANSFAIEPTLLYINLLSNGQSFEDFEKNESKILSIVENINKNFSKDKYATEYSMVSVYNRLATIYYQNKRYSKAIEFYSKALKEIGFIEGFFKKELSRQIELQLANSYYADEKISEANKVFKNIIDNIKDEEEKNMMNSLYLGNK